MPDMTITAAWKGTSVETGIERIKQQAESLKTGAVGGAFKALAQDLALASGPADMLAATMNRLAITLKGTFLGAAGLAVGKLLASPFEMLSQIVKESGRAMERVFTQLERAGSVVNVQQGISEMAMLQQTIDQISEKIKDIDENPFLRIASAVSGTTKELQGMVESLKRVGTSRVLEGVTSELGALAFRQGLSPDEQRLFDISEKTRNRVEQVRNSTTPGAEQDLAILKAYEIGARERNALLDQIAKEKEEASRRVRDALHVSEAKQELRMIDAASAGAAAAEAIARNSEQSGGQADGAGLRFPNIEKQTGSMQVLADSLQQVGGGGRFAQVGGLDAVQRDQLTVLKNIEKNTSKT
ncbi:hypothetical protein EBR78_10365, partial [bacterium]|nr:hypothetical protein [bacterium]